MPLEINSLRLSLSAVRPWTALNSECFGVALQSSAQTIHGLASRGIRRCADGRAPLMLRVQTPVGRETGVSLRQLLYMSELARPFAPGMLEEIAARSSENNERWQVSGCLLYSKGHFLQLLEGPQEEIERLFGVISADGRHARVRVLHDALVKKRLFDGWEMRTYNLEEQTKLPKEFVDRVLDWIEGHDNNPLFLFRILDDFRKHL
jgi:hypothetical protein